MTTSTTKSVTDVWPIDNLKTYLNTSCVLSYGNVMHYFSIFLKIKILKKLML